MGLAYARLQERLQDRLQDRLPKGPDLESVTDLVSEIARAIAACEEHQGDSGAWLHKHVEAAAVRVMLTCLLLDVDVPVPVGAVVGAEVEAASGAGSVVGEPAERFRRRAAGVRALAEHLLAGRGGLTRLGNLGGARAAG